MILVRIDYDKLRSAAGEIANRSARLALTTGIILAIACLTFARALLSANTSSAIGSAKEIIALAKSTGEAADLPWVFRLLKDDIGNNALPRDAALLRKHTLEQRMQQDVDSWFSVEPNLAGWHVKFNMLYWALAIPVVLWTAFSCLLINDAKIGAIRHLAMTQHKADLESATSFDRLTLGLDGGGAFDQYPGRITTVLYLCVVIGLVINVAVAAASLDNNILFAAIDPVRQLGVLTFYVVVGTFAVRRKIRSQAYASTGLTPLLTKPRLQRLRQRVAKAASRAWQALSCLGGVLVLTTLVLTTATAKSCNGASGTGADLFLNRKGLRFVTYEWWMEPIARIEAFGVWGYRICVIAGTLVVVAVLLTLIPGAKRYISRQGWLWRMLRAMAMTAWFFVLTEFGFVFALFGVPIQWPPLWEIVYWILPAIAYLVMTVIAPRRLRPLWDECIGPMAEVLFAPAVIFVPVALFWYYSDYPGVPALICGAGLMALALHECPLADRHSDSSQQAVTAQMVDQRLSTPSQPVS